MKKSNFRWLMLLPVFVLSLTAINCNDEPPPPMLYWAVYMPVDPIACIPTVMCPDAGNNCSTQFIHPALRTDQLSMLYTFQRMSQHDSAGYFFNHFDWQSMFPELNGRNEIVGKVMSGEYKVKLMADSSVVIASGDAYDSRNIVFAYDVDRAVTPCN